MASNYPGSLDSFTDKVDGVDDVAAAHVNDLQDAVEAVQAELGANPSGSAASVAAAIALKANKAGDTYTGTHDFTGATVTGISGGGSVDSVVGLTGDVTGAEILADSAVAAALAAKADASAVTTALAGKAPTSHSHAQSDVTGLSTALSAKADLASPVFTGNPTAPTPSSTDNDTSVATTAFVQAVLAAAGLAPGTDAWLKLHAAGNLDALLVGAITRDANGAATSAGVVWPDGVAGTYTATTVSSSFPGLVDAYTVTWGGASTKTVTQPAVTRDSTTGAVTNRPAMTVA